MPTIVLIDSDSSLRGMYEQKLRRAGFTTVGAGDGATGLAHVHEHKPDMVILDVVFPKFDGFSVLRRIKEHPDLAHIPVVFLTNLAQDEDIEKGKELGAAGYLIKQELSPGDVVMWVYQALGIKPS